MAVAPENVSSRSDLVRFMGELRDDLVSNPNGWENPTLERFLDALGTWTADSDGWFRNRGERGSERADVGTHRAHAPGGFDLRVARADDIGARLGDGPASAAVRVRRWVRALLADRHGRRSAAWHRTCGVSVQPRPGF